MVQCVRVEIGVFMLVAIYLGGLLVFVSIGLLVAREGCRRHYER